MFAVAYGAYDGSSPAFQAKSTSTAYSGRTAIRASPASARVRGTSRSAASADHVSKKAAETIASPKVSVSTGTDACHKPRRSEAAGQASSAMMMGHCHVRRNAKVASNKKTSDDRRRVIKGLTVPEPGVRTGPRTAGVGDPDCPAKRRASYSPLGISTLREEPRLVNQPARRAVAQFRWAS